MSIVNRGAPAQLSRRGVRFLAGVAISVLALGFTFPATARAAITLAGSSPGHNGTGAKSLTLTAPTAPAGALLLAQVTVNDLGTSDVICAPNGWVSVIRTNHSSATAQQIFRRVATTAEGQTDYTFQFRAGSCASSAVSSNKDAVGGILVYTGVDVEPVTEAVMAASGTIASATTVDAPSIPGPFPAGTRVVRFFGNDKEFVINAAGKIYDARRPKSGGGFEKPTGAAAHATLTAAGPTGTLQGSNSGNGGNWVAQTIVLRMGASNTAPTLRNVPSSTSICEGSEYTFDADATDPDEGQTLTFSLQGTLPAGAAIDGSTGQFSWTPAEDQDGIHTFRVRVTDNGDPVMWAEQEITITVQETNVAPVLASIGSKSVIIGDPLAFTVGSQKLGTLP